MMEQTAWPGHGGCQLTAFNVGACELWEEGLLSTWTYWVKVGKPCCSVKGYKPWSLSLNPGSNA